jgi:MarR family transcriptional regulator, transcriptional regulator for hemolysin
MQHRIFGYHRFMSGNTTAAVDRAKAPIPGDLAWNLGMVLRGYQIRIEEAMAELPAGFRGYQILSTVVHRDPENQQALGAHLAIDRTVLTYTLDTLVDAGLVERVPDPADRRARKILATAQGRDVLATYEDHVAGVEKQLLSGLAHDDVGQLTGLIARLAMNVHRAQPGSSPCEAMDHLS